MTIAIQNETSSKSHAKSMKTQARYTADEISRVISRQRHEGGEKRSQPSVGVNNLSHLANNFFSFLSPNLVSSSCLES